MFIHVTLCNESRAWINPQQVRMVQVLSAWKGCTDKWFLTIVFKDSNSVDTAFMSEEDAMKLGKRLVGEIQS